MTRDLHRYILVFLKVQGKKELEKIFVVVFDQTEMVVVVMTASSC